jgi:ABC-type phosphate/phosphonate transport system permease subunit
MSVSQAEDRKNQSGIFRRKTCWHIAKVTVVAGILVLLSSLAQSRCSLLVTGHGSDTFKRYTNKFFEGGLVDG